MQIILALIFLIVALAAGVLVPRKHFKLALTTGAFVLVLGLLWIIGFRAFQFIYDYYAFGVFSLAASGGFLMGLTVKRCAQALKG